VRKTKFAEERACPVRPLRDWICVRPLEYKHPILYVQGITLSRGIVVAVGPGRRMRRMVRYLKNPERWTDGYTYFADGAETGKIRPVQVKVGDCVEYSASDRRRGGTAFELEGQKLLMIPEQSVLGIDTSASTHEAILSQRAAGYDRHGNYLAGE
jgi:hypothetical protein